jgi:hypothetical protein
MMKDAGTQWLPKDISEDALAGVYNHYSLAEAEAILIDELTQCQPLTSGEIDTIMALVARRMANCCR